MELDWLILIVFVLVTTFTPGPNNISAAAMGMKYPYTVTVKYLLGIASGFLIIMLFCALLTNLMSDIITEYVKYIRIAGAGYIVWLALSLFRSSAEINDNEVSGTYIKGLLLQFLNPKGIIYGITLYSTFLVSLAGDWFMLVAFAFAFAFTSFTAVTLWSLFGTALQYNIKSSKLKSAINVILFVSLIYVAVDLVW